MSKQSLKFEQGLSIQELEERHELTVAIPADAVETAKDDNNDTTIERCSGNSGG